MTFKILSHALLILAKPSKSKIGTQTNLSEDKYIPQLTVANLAQSGRHKSRREVPISTHTEGKFLVEFILFFPM